MTEDEWAEDENSPADMPEELVNPISSRAMLGYVIVVVSALLAILQVILFFSSRWMRMESYNLFGDIVVKTTINPLLIWLPAWNAVLTAIWWSSCRKLGTSIQRIGLVVSMLLAVTFFSIAVSLESPPTFVIQRAGDQNLRMDSPYLDLRSY